MRMKLLLAVGAIVLLSAASQGATLSCSATAPTPGPNDIYLLPIGPVSAQSDNVSGGGSNGGDATYIANNRPANGESFTTGNNPYGYTLSAITLQQVTYGTYASIDTGWNTYNGDFVIYVGTFTGAVTNGATFNHDVVTGDMAPMVDPNPGNLSGGNGSGEYFTMTLATPAHLNPNTTYGFSVWSTATQYGGPYVEINGTNGDFFGGGTAFSELAGTVTAQTGDRVFLLSITTNSGPTSFTWDGGSSSGNNWSDNANWVGGTAPITSGADLTFAGSTRTSPVMDQNFSITGLNFSNNAAAFTLSAANGSTLTLGGNLVNNSSSAQTLDLPITLNGGEFNAAAGDLIVNGSLSGIGSLTKTGSHNLILNESGTLGGTLGVAGGSVNMTNVSPTFSGTSVSYVGLDANSGNLSISGGTVSVGGELSVGRADTGGPAENAVGTMTVSGGANVSLGKLSLAVGNNYQNLVSGTVTVTNATVSSENDLLLGWAGAGNAKLVVNNGGIVNVASTTLRWVYLSQWDTANSEIDINSGGQLNLNASTEIHFAVSGNSGTNTFNLNGGAVTTYSDDGTTVGGTGVLDLQYGYGAPVDTFNLNGGTLTVSGVTSDGTSGTRTFNFNGGTLKATSNNVGFVAIGSDPRAAANVLAGGAVIDDGGYNIIIPQALLHGTGATTDGGLTKLGVGQLILSGSNTFNGPINVSAGTLLVTPANHGSNSVTVATGAGFGAIEGSTSTLGNTTMGANSTLKVVLTQAVNPTSLVLNVSTLTLNGSTTLQLAGVVPQTGSFTVLHCASHTGAGSFNSTVVGLQGFVGTVNWSGNDLVVSVNSAGGSLVWSGSAGGDLWDIDSSQSWLLNGSPAYYQETTPPGDAVTFNDAGDPNVLIYDVVSPTWVVITNSTEDYTFYGYGAYISGTAGLTKTGSRMATMGAANDYTGNTIISSGTYQLGISGAIPGGAGKGSVVVNGTLDANGYDNTYNNLSGSGTVTNTGTTLARFYAYNTADSTFSGSIGGGPAGAANPMSLHTQGGSHTFTLSGNFTNYLQNLQLYGGTLKITAGRIITDSGGGYTALGQGANLEMAGGELDINSATNAGAFFPIGDSGGFADTLLVDGGTLVVSNNNGTSIGYNGSIGILTITSGLFVNSEQPGGFGLIVGDTGGQGATVNLNGGTLQTDFIWSRSPAVFNFNGGTLKPTASDTNFFGNYSATLTANVLAGGAKIDTAGFNITIAQPLTGPGGLTKNGAGTLDLSGGNYYTGDTVIKAGTLELAQSAPVLAANSTVSVANGALLQLDNGAVTNKVAGFITNGVAAANGVYSSANSSGFIAGAGYLQVGTVGPSGPETLTNSYNPSTHTLSLSWPAGQNWRLQTRTNLVLGSWQYLTDGSVNSTNIPVDATKPIMFYRLRYP